MLPYSHKKWFSPPFAIRYWHTEQIDRVHDSRKFQKAKEAWITAVALFGINALHDNQWWLQVPVDDPPDMHVMTIIPDGTDNKMHHREIEVMEITSFKDEPIDEAIARKLKNKFYVPGTGLIAYLNRNTQIRDIRQLALSLSQKNLNIADVWVLAAVSPEHERYALFSLFPDVEMVEFNLWDEFIQWPQGDMLDATRARGNGQEIVKAQATEFIPTTK